MAIVHKMPIIFCFILFIVNTYGISFNLGGTEKFCIGEDAIDEDVLVGTFKYDRGINVDGTIIMNIKDPFQAQKFESKSESGSFSIDIKQDGLYDICFWNTGRSTRSVTLEIKNTLKRDDKDKVKNKHIEPLQEQMQDIVNSAKHLSKDLEHLKEREWEMRDLNETTNSRVLSLSFLSIFIFVGSGICKLYYLKSFFSKKKLI